MEKEIKNQFFDEPNSINDVVGNYTKYYKWFIVSVITFVVIAFIFVRYSVPEYDVTASILIKEAENESSFDKLSSIEDFGLFGAGTETTENDIQLLKSRRLLTSTVEELKLNYQYFLKESPYDKELYPNLPVIVEIKSKSGIKGVNTSFDIVVKSKNKFDLIQFDEKIIEGLSFGKNFVVNVGNEDEAKMKTLQVEYNDSFKENVVEEVIRVKISPIGRVVDNYMLNLLIEPVNEKTSNVIKLSVTETVKRKGVALINNLIEQFNVDGINDKEIIAQATTDFLNERLKLISAELLAIEATAAQFKMSKGMINANAEANYFLQSSTATEGEMVSANTQLQLIGYMLDQLNNSNLTDPLPGNIGLSDLSIVNMLTEYNSLILRRNRVLKSSSIKNPIIVGIDSQLGVLRNNLIGSLKNLKSSSEISIASLSKKRGKINSKIASAPKYEKEFKDIIRDQETKNTLYLFLLQKREESILSNAVAINKAKIIDSAYSNGIPISPKTKLVYIASILLGFVFPMVIIYLKDVLDTKVHCESDLKQLQLPFLGDIPLSAPNKNIFITDGDNSSIAESFRYLRTNINFMLDVKEKGKTIYVTSTQSGEGKTFTAINLARSLALSGKKTLLLGMDLRSPKIFDYLGLENTQGVTNFIKNEELSLDNIVQKNAQLGNLDLINSGEIPPNPVELLMSKRVNELFEKIKETYEYIIVDTAPVGMVTDAMQISKYADLTIYIIKANVLDKRLLHIPGKLHKENKLPGMAILLNGSDSSKESYGYGYGYGKKEKKSWYKKAFNNAAF